MIKKDKISRMTVEQLKNILSTIQNDAEILLVNKGDNTFPNITEIQYEQQYSVENYDICTTITRDKNMVRILFDY